MDVMDLSGAHMGDRAAIAWAGALGRMLSQGVELRQLCLKENSLAGPGMTAVTAALAECRQLKTLDLTMNDLGGDGGPALGALLRSLPRDQLEKLQLSRCKLGDRNAKLIAEGLVGSTALKQLDMSRNGLGMGSVEGQRGQGAASAIATLLEARSCPLESICLSYNQLLAKHAGRIAAAFRHNQQLCILDLSWNSLANDGVMHLADALRGNRSLTKLDLTHVEMKERGAMVIADVLKENKVLKEIILNENPIGQRGGRALLRCASPALSPLQLILSYKSDKSLCGTGRCASLCSTAATSTFTCSAATTASQTHLKSSLTQRRLAGDTSSTSRTRTRGW